MLGRFRLTPLRFVGLALVAAFLAFAFWMNAPQPPLDRVLLPGVESGGLGLTRTEWDERYGPGTAVGLSSGEYTMALTSTARVLFKPEVVARIQYVESINIKVNSADAPRLTEADARTLGMSLLPSDATFVRSVAHPETRGQTGKTDFLTSESLVRLYRTACLPERHDVYERGVARIILTREVNRDVPYAITVSWYCNPSTQRPQLWR